MVYSMGIHTSSSSSSSILDPCLHIHSEDRVASSSDRHQDGHHHGGYDDVGEVFRQYDYEGRGDHSHRVLREGGCKGDTTLFAFDYRYYTILYCALLYYTMLYYTMLYYMQSFSIIAIIHIIINIIVIIIIILIFIITTTLRHHHHHPTSSSSPSTQSSSSSLFSL